MPDYGCRCGCKTFREHALGVNMSMAAMPTRKPEVVDTSKREERWNRDMPAYKRLRADGLTPKHIDGSGDVETRATDEVEVNKGKLFGKGLSMVKDADTLVREVKGT